MLAGAERRFRWDDDGANARLSLLSIWRSQHDQPRSNAERFGLGPFREMAEPITL
jgi:hypothetical protein